MQEKTGKWLFGVNMLRSNELSLLALFFGAMESLLMTVSTKKRDKHLSIFL